jgi:hypothetical protein
VSGARCGDHRRLASKFRDGDIKEPIIEREQTQGEKDEIEGQDFPPLFRQEIEEEIEEESEEEDQCRLDEWDSIN